MSSVLTAGPETAAEAFLYLKGFGGFGLFVATRPRALFRTVLG